MKKVDEILRAYIPLLGSQEGRDYLNLFSSWTAILGVEMADIAAHSEPVDIKNGALIVFVDHPGWMQKLEFRKKRILFLLGNRYPELGIRNIFVQKVNNEKFLERREARLMGNYPGTVTAATREIPEEENVSGQDQQSGQSSDQVQPDNESREEGEPNPVAESHYDERFKESLERLRKLGSRKGG